MNTILNKCTCKSLYTIVCNHIVACNITCPTLKGVQAIQIWYRDNMTTIEIQYHSTT